jgi:hypothetical protein
VTTSWSRSPRKPSESANGSSSHEPLRPNGHQRLPGDGQMTPLAASSSLKHLPVCLRPASLPSARLGLAITNVAGQSTSRSVEPSGGSVRRHRQPTSPRPSRPPVVALLGFRTGLPALRCSSPLVGSHASVDQDDTPSEREQHLHDPGLAGGEPSVHRRSLFDGHRRVRDDHIGRNLDPVEQWKKLIEQ